LFQFLKFTGTRLEQAEQDGTEFVPTMFQEMAEFELNHAKLFQRCSKKLEQQQNKISLL
jgi:rubrerythrin